MKKLFICLIILISFISSTTVAYAEGLNKDDNHSSIIDEMIDNIDLSDLEALLNQTPESASSIKEIILSAIKGEYISFLELRRNSRDIVDGERRRMVAIFLIE